jgi:hypothetical protein
MAIENHCRVPQVSRLSRHFGRPKGAEKSIQTGGFHFSYRRTIYETRFWKSIIGKGNTAVKSFCTALPVACNFLVEAKAAKR